MRPKYHSLVMMIVATAAALVAIVAGADRQLDQQHHLPKIKPLPDIAVPQGHVLAQMDRLQRRLPALAAGPGLRAGKIDLAALGYIPIDSGSGRGARDVAVPANIRDHQVTMAFFSPRKRFCVVDGRFYAEGGRLPDGARVIKIEARRVMLAVRGQRRWVSVSSPADAKETDNG